MDKIYVWQYEINDDLDFQELEEIFNSIKESLKKISKDSTVIALPMGTSLNKLTLNELKEVYNNLGTNITILESKENDI